MEFHRTIGAHNADEK